jgi:hypothetical protein
VKVRSTRRRGVPWLRHGAGMRGRLVDANGVSPGQACVFMTLEGQARVLGGGFIKSAVAAASPACQR